MNAVYVEGRDEIRGIGQRLLLPDLGEQVGRTRDAHERGSQPAPPFVFPRAPCEPAPLLPTDPLPHIGPMPRASFPNLTVLTHPLIAHKLSILRDRDTSTRDFKQLVGEIATLMAYEVTKDLPTEPVEIETPLERTTGRRCRERS